MKNWVSSLALALLLSSCAGVPLDVEMLQVEIRILRQHLQEAEADLAECTNLLGDCESLCK